jgi:hypothetical protein
MGRQSAQIDRGVITPVAILIAVATWQTDPTVQPLLCGNDSAHRPLGAALIDEQVVLLCPDCDYEQTEIPGEVLRRAGLNPS